MRIEPLVDDYFEPCEKCGKATTWTQGGEPPVHVRCMCHLQSTEIKTCGTCDHYVESEDENGNCHLNPPTLYNVQTGMNRSPEKRLANGVVVPGTVRMEYEVRSAYPPVRANLPGCSHHKPLEH